MWSGHKHCKLCTPIKRVDFDAVVDHLAITHIIKSKIEPATNRIKRLLEILSSCSFNLYYIKGKDMILSDFLPRQIEDESNLHEIISISFNIREILQENYLNITKDTYMMETRSQVKAQTNVPTIPSAKSIMKQATPKTSRVHIKAEKEKDSKMLPSRVDQQPPKRHSITSRSSITSNCHATNCQITPKAPKC